MGNKYLYLTLCEDIDLRNTITLIIFNKSLKNIGHDVFLFSKENYLSYVIDNLIL